MVYCEYSLEPTQIYEQKWGKCSLIFNTYMFNSNIFRLLLPEKKVLKMKLKMLCKKWIEIKKNMMYFLYIFQSKFLLDIFWKDWFERKLNHLSCVERCNWSKNPNSDTKQEWIWQNKIHATKIELNESGPNYW